MASEAGFLQAIRESPDDDDLRLVFADWLEERDAPYGPPMRAQVRLGQRPLNRRARAALVSQERVLLREHEARLFGPLPERTAGGGFVRGLLQVRGEAETFLAPVESGADAFAWVAELTLTG